MNNDLIDRLRDRATHLATAGDGETRALMVEAIDELERLQAKASSIVECGDDASQWSAASRGPAPGSSRT